MREKPKPKCKYCDGKHSSASHFAIRSKISDKGYPTSSPKYQSAHQEATKKEKERFPRKDFKKLEHMDRTVPKGELLGKNSKDGQITVSKRVPKALRKEVAYHEKMESEALKRKRGN